MIKRISILFLFITLIAMQIGYSATLIGTNENGRKIFLVETADRVNAQLDVSLSKSNDITIYNYTISVLPDSEQKLLGFSVTIDNLGLISRMPISSYAYPSKGDNYKKTHAYFSWGRYGQLNKGQSVSNLICEAKGIPGIVDVRFKGLTPGVGVDVSEPTPIIRKPPNFKAYKLGRAIAPIPKPSKPLDMINKLIELTTGAYNEKWISKDDVYQGLMDKLNSAKSQIQRGIFKYHTAKNIMNAYKHLLDAQRQKAIVEECYQMLYINADVMIDML